LGLQEQPELVLLQVELEVIHQLLALQLLKARLEPELTPLSLMVAAEVEAIS